MNISKRKNKPQEKPLIDIGSVCIVFATLHSMSITESAQHTSIAESIPILRRQKFIYVVILGWTILLVMQFFCLSIDYEMKLLMTT